MSASTGRKQAGGWNRNQADVAEHVAKLVAEAPPISEAVRTKLSALLSIPTEAKGAA
ncbi:hypothetical protein [Nocardia sp. NPDC046763]|uniref:hypothetical protein n=1 Tax=Nocardia sp. NPDC046763 TaxID=3155256 RepID=UPI003403A2C5